jgi:Lipid A core - O-antigen ligase and related enzymes
MQRVEEQETPIRVRRAGSGERMSATWKPRALVWVERLIFSGLLFIIVLTAIPYGTVEPWWEAIFQCFIFSLVALWIVEGMVRGEWGVKGLRLLAPMLAIIVYAFVQTLNLRGSGSSWPTISADPYGTRFVALKLLALALAGALLYRYTSSRRRLRALIYVVLITAVVSAIFGMIRETTHQGGPGFLLPQLKPQVGYGQFINRNHFAYLMEMAFGLALGLAVGRGEQKDRLIYIAAALPVWMALVLSNSRGGVFSMISQLLFLIIVYGLLRPAQLSIESQRSLASFIHRMTSNWPVRILLIVGLLGALVVGMMWIGGDPLAKRFETLQSEVAGDDAVVGEGARRIQIWQATWRMFKDHPLTGIGFGSYWVAITEYYNVPGKKRPYEAHNDYLELLVSGGIIAVPLVGWFIYALFKQARQTFQAKDAFRRAACLGAVTGLFGIAVHSLVDFGLHITINALICVALIVIATVDVKPDAKTDAEETSELSPRLRRYRDSRPAPPEPADATKI